MTDLAIQEAHMPRIMLHVPVNCRITIKEVKRTDVTPLEQFIEVENETEKPVKWITKRATIPVEPPFTVRLEAAKATI